MKNGIIASGTVMRVTMGEGIQNYEEALKHNHVYSDPKRIADAVLASCKKLGPEFKIADMESRLRRALGSWIEGGGKGDLEVFSDDLERRPRGNTYTVINVHVLPVTIDG